MGSRVTIVLDDTNAEKLINLQAKMIKTSSWSVSFSHVLNIVLEYCLKKHKPYTQFKSWKKHSLKIISNEIDEKKWR